MTTVLFAPENRNRLDPLVRAQRLLQAALLPRLAGRIRAAGAQLAEWQYPDRDWITAGYYLLPGQPLPDAAPIAVRYVTTAAPSPRHLWDGHRPLADDARQGEAITALAGLLGREGWRVLLLCEPPTAGYYCPCVLVYEGPKQERTEVEHEL